MGVQPLDFAVDANKPGHYHVQRNFGGQKVNHSQTNAASHPVDLAGICEDAPTVMVRGYLDTETATKLAAAFRNLSLSPYVVTESAAAGPAYYFGANLYDSRPETSMSAEVFDDYFRNAASDREHFNNIVAAASLPHPITDIFVPLLSSVFGKPVAIAAEAGREYYTPVVRSIANGLHAHTDNSPLEAPELIIGNVTAQRSMLLYLAAPGDGSGAAEVFHKRPTEYDNEFNKDPDYGYTDAAIEGVDLTHLEPEVGDLVVFDSWNIHRVLPSTIGTRRVTVSTFYGMMPDGTIVLWS